MATNTALRQWCCDVLDEAEQHIANEQRCRDFVDPPAAIDFHLASGPAALQLARALLPTEKDCTDLDALHPPAMNGFARHMEAQIGSVAAYCHALYAALPAEAQAGIGEAGGMTRPPDDIMRAIAEDGDIPMPGGRAEAEMVLWQKWLAWEDAFFKALPAWAKPVYTAAKRARIAKEQE